MKKDGYVSMIGEVVVEETARQRKIECFRKQFSELNKMRKMIKKSKINKDIGLNTEDNIKP